MQSLSPNAILEVEKLCKITVEPGAEPVFNFHFLYGGVFVNNITQDIQKEGPSFIERGDQADAIPIS